MDLQHIDIRAQPSDARVDRVEDVLPRQPDPVDPDGAVVGGGGRDGRGPAVLVDAEEALGQDDDALAGDGELFQGLADDLLGAAVGVDVGL